MKTLSDLDESIGLQSGGARGSGVPALVDARKTVERQVSRMDQMVRGFEKVMHKRESFRHTGWLSFLGFLGIRI